MGDPLDIYLCIRAYRPEGAISGQVQNSCKTVDYNVLPLTLPASSRVCNCSARCIRTNLSSNGEGVNGFGPPTAPARLRHNCIGVNTKPQGRPHQPKHRQNIASSNCLFTAQDLQDTRGLLLH